ncbi:MAG TPA: glycosyltransferase family 2 protein [Rhizomicrobium sp.]|nr:glycosyltransferase family 2 protein [Rhizomicrobium sp.]
MPDITITIPTFRRPKGLERLLLAIDALETEANVRVLVADNDAEKREGVAVVERLRSASGRWPIEVFVVEQRGIAQARNALVARALSGPFDWLAMLDDDEWPESSWLTAFLRVATETGADALHGAVVPEFEKPPGRWAARCYGFAPLRNPTGPIAMIHGTGNAFLSRQVLAKLARPWFDPGFALTGGEDKDFFTRLKIAGAHLAWADEAVVHTEMPSSRANARWAVKRAFRVGNSDMRVFLKHTHALPAKVFEGVKIGGALVLSLPFVLLAAPLAEWRVLPVCKFARAAGKLSAALGLRYDEYAVTHGR